MSEDVSLKPVENRLLDLWSRRWFQWASILAIWTIIGLAFGGQTYFTARLGERPISWRDAYSAQLIFTTLWALATPAVLWIAARLPVDQRSWRRSVPLHLLFSIVLAIYAGGLFHVFYFLLNSWGIRPFVFTYTVRSVINNASENIGIYALILFLQHAVAYYNRFREGELRASKLKAQLAQAQVEALKMQLHPHFLFNTLHSISSLIHKDSEAADRMIARLGDFLRLTLENSGKQEVKLEEELEFLKCYLEIEQVRFYDRLATDFFIEPQTLDLMVPNLILQPIVENAIRHGIAPRSSPGRIEIRAEQDNGRLSIQVKDNGPGLKLAASGEGVRREGLGLANTRARLRQHYGDQHRFDILSEPSGGMIVRLEIPSNANPS